MMGVSNVPFGDLSVSFELSDASIDAFLLSKSIFLLLSLFSFSSVRKPLLNLEEKRVKREWKGNLEILIIYGVIV